MRPVGLFDMLQGRTSGIAHAVRETPAAQDGMTGILTEQAKDTFESVFDRNRDLGCC